MRDQMHEWQILSSVVGAHLSAQGDVHLREYSLLAAAAKGKLPTNVTRDADIIFFEQQRRKRGQIHLLRLPGGGRDDEYAFYPILGRIGRRRGTNHHLQRAAKGRLQTPAPGTQTTYDKKAGKNE